MSTKSTISIPVDQFTIILTDLNNALAAIDDSGTIKCDCLEGESCEVCDKWHQGWENLIEIQSKLTLLLRLIL